MKLTASHTKLAGYIGYFTQALSINFAPLLFVTFSRSYGISLANISLLIAISFIAQLLTDAFEAKFAPRLNTRATVITGLVLAAVGITGYAYLPDIMPTPFAGLLICTLCSAVGAGIVEVLISPIIEACPTGNKSAAMSYLHSFYCWGQAGVVLLSTLFFSLFGIDNWQILALLWAIVPISGAVAFAFVPIYELEADSAEASKSVRSTKNSSVDFFLFFILMFCAGAAEMAMSQWASTFAERGLGISKSVGDLLGPCAFATFMGATRVFHGKLSHRIDLKKFILLSSVLCVISYLIAALSPIPVIALLSCALCGLSVGVMWPGTYSLAVSNFSSVGIRMFAILALGGDLGCTVGPALAGFVASALGDSLAVSFLISAIFPISIIAILLVRGRSWRSTKD